MRRIVWPRSGVVLTFAALCSFSVAGETIHVWRGETRAVWRDLTNTTASAVLVKPVCAERFVRTGVAKPVKGDDDVLYADRPEWGGSSLVEPDGVVRIVAEITVPRTGPVPPSVSVTSALGAADYELAVCERQFPEGKDRRTFLDLWQHPWAVARYYRVKPFSEEHYAKMRPLWTRLGAAGQKVVTATIMDRPWAHQCFDAYGSMVRHIKAADGSWTFDYAVFDEYVKFAFDCGLGPQIHCYSVCPFRLKRYYWEDEQGRQQFGDFDVGSPDYLAYWEPFLVDFAKHLKSKGLFEQTYIALDERSPAELRAAYELVKRCGGFKIAMAGDRRPDQFDGVEIDNFSIALQCVTLPYIASAKARRREGKTTSVYVAGGNPCTGTAQPLIDCQWLGAYPGAVDLDGFLRWAWCSWPANPNSDTTYDPWFGHWAAGGTYLAYPDGPSMRCLALFNGLNLAEKVKILRDEGKIDAELAAALADFEYKGRKAYATYPAADVLRRTESLVHRICIRADGNSRNRTQLYPDVDAEYRDARIFEPSVNLFNGKDLSGWYTYLKGRGRNIDPEGVITVTNGLIRISGKEFGALVTEAEYADYRLDVEYRFTGTRYGCKKDKALDSGILFHSTGPDGGFAGIWLYSHEYNLITGASGDIWTVGDAKKRPDMVVEGESGGTFSDVSIPEGPWRTHAVWKEGGKKVELRGNRRLCRFDISPKWTDTPAAPLAANENPTGAWNLATLVCRGETVECWFNGKLVNKATRVVPSCGKIQLQSEGCGIEFRRVDLQKLK